MVYDKVKHQISLSDEEWLFVLSNEYSAVDIAQGIKSLSDIKEVTGLTVVLPTDAHEACEWVIEEALGLL